MTNELIWSRECWLLYGRDPERDLARYELWRECLHPEDLEPTERLLRHVLDRRLPEYRTEYRVIRPNGDMRWLAALGEMEFSADGAPLRLSGINIDITEQKRAKEETEEILASIADGFYALDRDWRFNYFNPGAERLLGKKRDDVVGLSIFEVFPLLRGSPLHANFRKAMTVRQPLAFRCWGPTLKRWAAFNVYPFQLRFIRFLGPGKETVEFPFKSGFNILYGSSDTGKTFLVEAIDFMLGAGDDLRDIPERNGFDSILLGLSAHGKDYTVQRSVNKGAFRLYDGLLDEIPPDEKLAKKLSAIHTTKNYNNLSHWLLQEIGLDNKHILYSKEKGTLRSLGFRALAHLCVIAYPRITSDRKYQSMERAIDGAIEPMAQRPVIDDGEEPAELNIGIDKIQDIVLKAREFDQEDFPDEPDPGADADPVRDREEQLDEGDDPAGEF